MAKKPLPTPDELRQLLRYEPETGKLFWLPRGVEWFPEGERRNNACAIWNSRFAGKEALAALSNGYKHGAILGQNYPAHRVCWSIFYGEHPSLLIDHINGDKVDNRIINLREVTNSENAKNSKMHVGNKSGRTGVFRDEARNIWIAYIMSEGVRRHLGNFTEFSRAVEARSAAEIALGFHPNHGRR